MEYINIFNILISPFLLIASYFTSRIIERNHYISLSLREAKNINMLVTTSEEVPTDLCVYSFQMVSGNVVISASYFKRFAGFLRNIFGGRISVYESLVDRARREAILRMKEQAGRAQAVICTRIITTRVGKGMVETLAVGTALWEAPDEL